MGTIGKMPGGLTGFPPLSWPFRRKNRDVPHPMDIHSGQYEQHITARRLVGRDHEQFDVRVFGVMALPTTIAKRTVKWGTVDRVFVRLMVITRLDRSRCDEDV